jgi:hypothetical protein
MTLLIPILLLLLTFGPLILVAHPIGPFPAYSPTLFLFSFCCAIGTQVRVLFYSGLDLGAALLLVNLFTAIYIVMLAVRLGRRPEGFNIGVLPLPLLLSILVLGCFGTITIAALTAIFTKYPSSNASH